MQGDTWLWASRGGRGRVRVTGSYSPLSLLEHLSGVYSSLRDERSRFLELKRNRLLIMQWQREQTDAPHFCKRSKRWDNAAKSRRRYAELHVWLVRDGHVISVLQQERGKVVWPEQSAFQEGELTLAFSTDSPLLTAFFGAAWFSSCSSWWCWY